MATDLTICLLLELPKPDPSSSSATNLPPTAQWPPILTICLLLELPKPKQSLPVSSNSTFQFEPINGRGDNGRYSCKKAACAHRITDDCPNELKLNGPGAVVGCKSACLAFNTDQYCCRNAFNSPEKCRSSAWPHDYPAYFKGKCPDAYSYAYDDHKSTFTCKAQKYVVTFGV